VVYEKPYVADSNARQRGERCHLGSRCPLSVVIRRPAYSSKFHVCTILDHLGDCEPGHKCRCLGVIESSMKILVARTILTVLTLAGLFAMTSSSSALCRSPAAAKASVLVELRDLRMLGPQVGWAEANGGVVRTVDGGSTWNLVGPRAYSSDVKACQAASAQSADAFFALGPRTAWVAFHCVNDSWAAHGLIVWRTTTAGHSWSSSTVKGGSKRASGLLLLERFMHGHSGSNSIHARTLRLIASALSQTPIIDGVEDIL
jgi:hypothetical protein